jgi:hypothetical protein
LIVANRFRPQRELHRLIHEQLVNAVEDRSGRPHYTAGTPTAFASA